MKTIWITSRKQDHNFNKFHIGPETMEHDISAMLRETCLTWTVKSQALRAPFLRCSASADGLERQVDFTIRRRSIACYLGDLYKENWEDSLPS